jgi:cold shock CspA family protein
MIDRNPSEDHAHEDAFVAVRDAFAAARRRLQDRRRRQRGQVKLHEASPEGHVMRVDAEQGFGFIETADGREIYFHRNSVLNGGFERLCVGAPVRFAEEAGEKGAQASTVRLVGRRQPA